MALAEDLGAEGDVTTTSVFPREAMARAVVVAKADGVLSASRVFASVFELLGDVQIEHLADDGARVATGDVILRLEGRVWSILAGERTALNLLQRMSGVASLTRQIVDATVGRLAICDTRKTTPLWRDLEKAAVVHGGGTNHRMGLHDMVMLKDTHADGAGSLREALLRVQHLRPRLKVAAEARTREEVLAALEVGADLLMLDNMPAEVLAESVRLIDRRIATEVTGNVTLERARALAELGIDRVSIGALTHSAKALDFSLRIAL
jgi:nicotinate-nucleotide pyrophosphorylase (carboxylating)